MARGNNRSSAIAPPSGFTLDDSNDDYQDLQGDVEDDTIQSVDVVANAALPEDENMDSYEHDKDSDTATSEHVPQHVTPPVTPPVAQSASEKGPGYRDVPCLDTQAAAQVNAKFREGRRVEKLLVDGRYVYRLYD